MDKIDRGEAIYGIVRTKGWEYLEEYIIEKEIKPLRNSLLAGGFSNIEEYNRTRFQYEMWNRLLELPEKWIKEKNKLVEKDNK